MIPGRQMLNLRGKLVVAHAQNSMNFFIGFQVFFGVGEWVFDPGRLSGDAGLRGDAVLAPLYFTRRAVLKLPWKGSLAASTGTSMFLHYLVYIFCCIYIFIIL